MNSPPNSLRWSGIVAAAVTPFDGEGELKLELIGPMVERLIDQGVNGLYVCGSTGEGPSMTGAERRLVTEEYLRVVQGRVPVMVQVGHNSIREARELAEHAAQRGADAISATCPSYFPISGVQTLVDCMATLTRGIELPFFYYHIPSLTGVEVSMVEFLTRAPETIPTLAGLKYTQTTVHDYQRCLGVADGAFQILWGCDEMFLSALCVGAPAAVGSTYNLALPAYSRLQSHFEKGDLSAAREVQAQAVRMVTVLCRYPFHSALKSALALLGVDAGVCRLPFPRLQPEQEAELHRDLEALDLVAWASARGSDR